MIKKVIATLSIMYVTAWSFVSYPKHSEAYTIALADKFVHPKSESFKKSWTVAVSKSYAKTMIQLHYPQWSASSEYRALVKLWTKESNWNHQSKNKESTAFGIPQILDLDPSTPAPRQIERGLSYIDHRYKSPSKAWEHWRKHGWY